MRFLVRSTFYSIYGALTGAVIGVIVAYQTERVKRG